MYPTSQSWKNQAWLHEQLIGKSISKLWANLKELRGIMVTEKSFTDDFFEDNEQIFGKDQSFLVNSFEQIGIRDPFTQPLQMVSH